MNETTGRLATALGDRYRIERELGAGGMATVYLAEDLRHKRRVAVKVLKPELAAVLGAGRFVVEITTTAALQHPHILPLFDSGEADGFLYYVMPFIDGETLRTRLDRETQLGIDESVKIATAVADALDYAHRHGVIHRDIKPENILLHDGRPMVADFGIALALSAAAGGRMTETGLSLGTPHYMSPEQATAEKEITGRSDVYSLASVLYEMLAGDPPHTGSSAQQVIMKIITEQPQPVTTLRKSVPANVAAAVAKALEKLPADRFESAKAFADALGNARFATAGQINGGRTNGGAMSCDRRGVSWLVFACTCLAAVALTAVIARETAHPAAASPETLRFGFSVYPSEPLGATLGRTLALSADGRVLAYSTRDSAGTIRIFVRRMDEAQPRAVPGTETGISPFMSPDGRYVGYVTDRRQLRKIPLAGGTGTLLAEVEQIAGASWGPDGIVVSTNGRLMLVPDEGGAPAPLLPGDSVRGYRPIVLPGGKAVVFVTNTSSSATLAVANRASRRVTDLGLSGTFVVGFVDGYLIFIRADDALMAVPFDPSALRVTGPPRVAVGQVSVNPAGYEAKVAVSSTGTLAYVSGSGLYQAVTVDMRGAARASGIAPGRFSSVRYSPNGKQIAATLLSAGRSDIYIYDAGSGAGRRVTFEGTLNERPEWSADGSRILYRTNRDSGGISLWWQRADGTGSAEQLLAVSNKHIWEGVLLRDNSIVYRTGSLGDAQIMFRRHGDSVDTPVATTRFTEQAASVSPDGRWVAYQSDESGRYEVYVRPLPGPGGQSPVSTNGGTLPLWSADGHSIYFVNGTDMVAARVAANPTFAVLSRSVLFSGFYLTGAGHAAYDVAPDGKSFLMLQPVPGASEQVMVVHDWVAELRASAGGAAARRK